MLIPKERQKDIYKEQIEKKRMKPGAPLYAEHMQAKSLIDLCTYL
jgi:hypothetical protein